MNELRTAVGGVDIQLNSSEMNWLEDLKGWLIYTLGMLRRLFEDYACWRRRAARLGSVMVAAFACT